MLTVGVADEALVLTPAELLVDGGERLSCGTDSAVETLVEGTGDEKLNWEPDTTGVERLIEGWLGELTEVFSALNDRLKRLGLVDGILTDAGDILRELLGITAETVIDAEKRLVEVDGPTIDMDGKITDGRLTVAEGMITDAVIDVKLAAEDERAVLEMPVVSELGLRTLDGEIDRDGVAALKLESEVEGTEAETIEGEIEAETEAVTPAVAEAVMPTDTFE
ncbi:hypothetical protein AMS68_001349 [Peltaster fructicola]|uniref:Uncharacterized protein n=1 Tax=Peltaster fructicola TaxID=286661 RepID=A0A6H0XM50_9PEZI|nr:hypothetical protein AMS68_001349 [Peltaster fructicola]